MKSRFVYSQTAWERIKYFVKGPTAIVHQSMAEAIAYRDNVWDPELKKLLNSYIEGCKNAVGFQGDADKDIRLEQKIIRNEENLTSSLRDWANSQISILKADGKGDNKLAFDLLKKIANKAQSNKTPALKPPTTNSPTTSTPSDNSEVQVPSSSKVTKNKSSKFTITPKTYVSDNSKPLVYNHKNNSSGESSDVKYIENKMEGYYTEEPKKPADYSDYFDKIKTGNDFLFLAVSKVFPEIQTYGKDPMQKSKIEGYWKIENKEKIKNKLEEISENPWIVRNYPHIPLLLPSAIEKLDQKMSAA
jgi:hypothetical protein